MNRLTIRLVLLALALLGIWYLYPPPTQEATADIIRRTTLTVNVPGSGDGNGGSAETGEVIQGRVVRVDIDYAAGITTTTDLTLYDATDLIDMNLVSRTDTVTDAQVFPTISLTDNTGAAVTYDGTREIKDYPALAGKLTATLTQTTAATPAVTMDIYWIEEK